MVRSNVLLWWMASLALWVLGSTLPLGSNPPGAMEFSVEQATLGLEVFDPASGQRWTSVFQGNDRALNAQWTAFFSAGFSVEYVNPFKQVVRHPVLQRDPAATDTLIRWQPGESPVASVWLEVPGIGFDVVFEALDDGSGVQFSVPAASIVESRPGFRLQSIWFFPFLEASRSSGHDGYIFLPDGCGVLLSLEHPTLATQPFDKRVYGPDPGMMETVPAGSGWILPEKQVLMPVYGVANPAGEKGFLAIVTSGDAYAKMYASPASVITPYNWVGVRFLYRQSYRKLLDKKGTGITVSQEKRNDFDASVRYVFLTGEQASWVGMAKAYREFLQRQGVLTPLPEKAEGTTPLHLDFLMAENRSRMLGRELIPMTTLYDVHSMLHALQQQGISEVVAVLKGYTKGGWSGSSPSHLPFEPAILGDGVSDPVGHFLENVPPGTRVFFHVDYARVYPDGKGYRTADLAMNVSNQFLTTGGWPGPDTGEDRFLPAARALEWMQREAESFSRWGIDHLAVDTLGNVLYSSWGKQPFSRKQTLETWQSIPGSLTTAFSNPAAYLWKQSALILDVDSDSSGYLLGWSPGSGSMTVPFLQLVLKGSIDMFSPFANFFADLQGELLWLVATGVYPSFVLTQRDPVNLSRTAHEWVYSSQFAVWEPFIVQAYDFVDHALRWVRGQAIEDFQGSLETGCSVRYANGVHIELSRQDGYRVLGPDGTVLASASSLDGEGE